MSSLIPIVNPDDIVLDGWDIAADDLATAMQKSKVLDYNLQQKLVPLMKNMKPRPSFFDVDFVAANQVLNFCSAVYEKTLLYPLFFCVVRTSEQYNKVQQQERGVRKVTR